MLALDSEPRFTLPTPPWWPHAHIMPVIDEEFLEALVVTFAEHSHVLVNLLGAEPHSLLDCFVDDPSLEIVPFGFRGGYPASDLLECYNGMKPSVKSVSIHRLNVAFRRNQARPISIPFVPYP